jgi:hypothetical protein
MKPGKWPQECVILAAKLVDGIADLGYKMVDLVDKSK